MSVIGTKRVTSEGLEALINRTFRDKQDAIAILERWFCRHEEEPDFFGYLSSLSSKVSGWDRGRVFNGECEIRWEKGNDAFHVVWIDDTDTIADNGWEKEEIHQGGERKVLLWGERINGETEWYEKQVPRIFEYPVEGKGERVYAVLNEYAFGDSSTVYRFKEVRAE
jgi:hypothetical protein